MMIRISINQAPKQTQITFFFFSQSMLKLKPICRVTFMVLIHAVHANLWQRVLGWVTWGTELYISSDQKEKAIFISSFTNYNCDFQAFKLLILTNCPCKAPLLIVCKLTSIENEG